MKLYLQPTFHLDLNLVFFVEMDPAVGCCDCLLKLNWTYTILVTLNRMEAKILVTELKLKLKFNLFLFQHKLNLSFVVDSKVQLLYVKQPSLFLEYGMLQTLTQCIQCVVQVLLKKKAVDCSHCNVAGTVAFIFK